MVELREQKELLASVGQEGEFVAELPQKWEQIRRLAALASLACEFAGTYRLAVGTPALSESGLAKKNAAPGPSGAGTGPGATRPAASAPARGGIAFGVGPGHVRLFPARVLRAPAGARPLGAPKG